MKNNPEYVRSSKNHKTNFTWIWCPIHVMHVQCSTVKKDPFYVNIWMSLIPSLNIWVALGPWTGYQLAWCMFLLTCTWGICWPGRSPLELGIYQQGWGTPLCCVHRCRFYVGHTKADKSVRAWFIRKHLPFKGEGHPKPKPSTFCARSPNYQHFFFFFFFFLFFEKEYMHHGANCPRNLKMALN